jgi:hypothetical protein
VRFGPPPVAPSTGGTAAPAERVERWRAWLETFASALETGDGAAIDRLFAVETSYQPGPFAAILNGRRAIRAYLEGVRGDRAGLAISAEALGVGATYAIAHWRHEWSSGAADGIVLAAFDPFGRCTSFREWTLRGS